MSESRARATRVDHISIVVEDFDRAFDFYANLLGLEVLKVEESELHGVKAAFLKIGDMMVEIIQPLGDGPIADSITSRSRCPTFPRRSTRWPAEGYAFWESPSQASTVDAYRSCTRRARRARWWSCATRRSSRTDENLRSDEEERA